MRALNRHGLLARGGALSPTMARRDLSLELPPVELLRRLPRRAGSFLLDGGGDDSWGSGEALIGWEPSRIVAFDEPPPAAPGGDGAADPFALPAKLLEEVPCAGVACALAYDLGRWVEHLGPGPAERPALPQLFAAAHPWVLAYSYRERRYELRAPHLGEAETRAVAARIEAVARAPRVRSPAAGGEATGSRANFTREAYLTAVRRVLEYIAAGDVYQVNLSQRFTATTPLAPAEIFARVLARHPAPYSAFLDGGAWALVSNSPECFLRLDGERVSTFPIKGTRPRGDTPEADKAMARALLSSVKERAEHLMIVDLERNDLGRVCRFGTVHVPAFARLRTFASLHHVESEVAGRLAPNTSLAALLRATFPGGSITGAPKVRAMQIIDELEPAGRGFYTGAIGFVGRERSCFNIAIRTATVAGANLSYHAGGGVVADSDPAAEYDESRLKARAFLDVLAEVDA